MPQHTTPAQIAEITRNLNGPELIRQGTDALFWGRGDLSTASGLTSSRIKALADGKRPTKAERAAISWAIAMRLCK